MKITTVRVSCLFNVGNYENQRFDLEAKLEDSDTPEAVADDLKHQIHLMADKENQYRDRNILRREIKLLETDVAQAREEWEQTRAFLMAQGLQPHTPEFPILVRKPIQAACIQMDFADVVEAGDTENCRTCGGSGQISWYPTGDVTKAELPVDVDGQEYGPCPSCQKRRAA